MFVNAQKAQKIFRLSPLAVTKDGNTTYIEGNEFEYKIIHKDDSFQIFARELEGENKKWNQLFVGIREYEDTNGDVYRLSNPYFMFDTEKLNYVISIRKQRMEGLDWKTVHYYNFEIK